MATYIALQGIQIQVIAGDPANPVEGQIWYDTTNNRLRGYNGSANVTITAS